MTPLASDIKQLIPTLTRIDECLGYFDSHVCSMNNIHGKEKSCVCLFLSVEFLQTISRV